VTKDIFVPITISFLHFGNHTLESKTPPTKAMAAAVTSNRPIQVTAIAETPIAPETVDGTVSTPPPQPAPKWPPDAILRHRMHLPLRGFIGQVAAPEPVKVYDAPIEEGKLRSVEESIRMFVRAADSKSRQIVPMSFFNRRFRRRRRTPVVRSTGRKKPSVANMCARYRALLH
jgi:hypothetical protein